MSSTLLKPTIESQFTGHKTLTLSPTTGHSSHPPKPELGTTKNTVSAEQLNLINSLGGDPLPLGSSKQDVQVTLANYASTHCQVWQLEKISASI